MTASEWWSIGGTLLIGLFVAYLDRTNLSVAMPQLSKTWALPATTSR